MLSLSVRAADYGDAYSLWVWANDADTRKASFGRGEIGWEDHVAWLREQLTNTSARIFIAQTSNNQPVGYVRFDTQDGWTTARLSYAVALESRRRGLARLIVDAGVKQLEVEYPHARIRAEVAPDNEPSLRVFETLGWSRRPIPGTTMLVFWKTSAAQHEQPEYDNGR
jgi:ribosomal protein S18 acetylase RimI-like enzyme